jgi:hypothetical protein
MSATLTAKLFCAKVYYDLMQVVEKIRPPHTPFLNLQSYCPTNRIRLYTTPLCLSTPYNSIIAQLSISYNSSIVASWSILGKDFHCFDLFNDTR